MKSIYAPIPMRDVMSLSLKDAIATDCRHIRAAQKRCENAFMALPITIPHAQFIHYANATEDLCVMTNVAYLMQLTEEMEDITEAHNAGRIPPVIEVADIELPETV